MHFLQRLTVPRLFSESLSWVENCSTLLELWRFRFVGHDFSSIFKIKHLSVLDKGNFCFYQGLKKVGTLCVLLIRLIVARRFLTLEVISKSVGVIKFTPHGTQFECQTLKHLPWLWTTLEISLTMFNNIQSSYLSQSIRVKNTYMKRDSLYNLFVSKLNLKTT